jgi:WD40 repeat protein
MMSDTASPNPSNALADILADFLLALERGETPDRAALLAQHPDWAQGLRDFFADHDRLRQIVNSPTLQPSNVFEAPTGLFLSESPPLGTRIRYLGDYELLEELARGGMGVVYQARQVSLSRLVAIKMILSGQLASPEDVQRFRSEAEAAANLDHPHIVPIYEVGEHEGQHYFSMKLIEGGCLSQAREARQKTLSFKEFQRWAASLVATVARAVHHAHQRGILHRDLKPGNVLLDGTGQPHVTDFGLAKKVEGGSDVTHTGVIVGTPAYMAPEQARCEKVLTTAVDVYSLGAILYEVLTGQAPFKAATPLDTILEVLEKEPVQPRSIIPAVDRDLETIALKCLEKDPTRRYGSAEALAEELERWLQGAPILARPVGHLERSWRWCRRNPVVAGLAASFLIALILGVIASSAFALEASQRAAAESLARQDERAQRRKAQEALQEAHANLYANHINLAYQYWTRSRLAQEDQILQQCPVDLRAWEWRYLRRLNETDLLTLPGKGQDSSIHLSRDGKRLEEIFKGDESNGCSAVAWDLVTQKRLSEVRLPKGIYSGSISPDGTTVAVDAIDVVMLFDAVTGQKKAHLEKVNLGGYTYTPSLAFSPNGRWLSVGGYVWDLATQKTISQSKTMIALAFNPNGKQLLYLTENRSLLTNNLYIRDHTAHLMDASTWKRIYSLGEITNYSFSADGRLLALQNRRSTQEGTQPVRIIETETGKEINRLPLPFDSAMRLGSGYFLEDMALSPDATLLAAVDAEEGTKINIWDVSKRKMVRTLKGHTDTIVCLRFTPDGKRLISSSKDKTIKFWDPWIEQSYVLVPGKIPFAIRHAAFSPDARLVAVAQEPVPARVFFSAMQGGRTWKILLWNVDSGAKAFDLPGVTSEVLSIAYSLGGKFIAASSQDGAVHIWDAESGKLTNKFAVQGCWGLCVALSPDGQWAASSYQPGETFEEFFRQSQAERWKEKPPPAGFTPGMVKVWNNRTSKEQFTLIGHKEAVHSLAFSPNGKILATASDHNIRLWDTQSGLEIRTLVGPKHDVNGHFKIEFSPNGANLLMAANGETWIFDVSTGMKSHTLRGDGSLAMMTESHRLAVVFGKETRELKFWDMIRGHELLTLPLTMSRDRFHDASNPAASIFLPTLIRDVAALRFTPDNHRLYGILRDGTILYWDGSPITPLP